MVNGLCHIRTWESLMDMSVWGWVSMILPLVFAVGLLGGIIVFTVRAMKSH